MTAGFVFGLFLAEGVGLIGEVAAEDDRVGPDVADQVGGDVGGQRALERLTERAPGN